MPKVLQDIEEIKNRKSEIMVRFCKVMSCNDFFFSLFDVVYQFFETRCECLKVKCKENTIFEVRDKSGNVLESANNSAGIYSMLQGLPEPPPTPTRLTIYEKHGAKTTIKCPG